MTIMRAGFFVAAFCILMFALTPVRAEPLPVQGKRAEERLPDGALVRLGHARMVCSHPHRLALIGGQPDSLAISPDGKWISDGSKWFAVDEGREKPAPVYVPAGYSFARFFSDGSYLVGGDKDCLIF